MRGSQSRLALPALVLVASACSAPVADSQFEVLVALRAGASERDKAELRSWADAALLQPIATVAGGEIHRLRSRSPGVEQQLRRHPAVLYVEPNHFVHAASIPNDTRFGELYGLLNTGQSINGTAGIPGADIAATYAWNFTVGTEAVVVGMIDTGFDYNHPDLAANAWSNPGGIGGCAAGTHGFNAITGTCDPFDGNGHGTQVAGTIGAAGNNGIGVAGVAWRASLMGLKALGSDGSGTVADVITAIDFAVAARLAGVNLRVLSSSWGSDVFSQALLDEINKANDNGILFVAAAGNDAADNDLAPFYPASYQAPNIVAVAATDNRDQLASFSNFGAGSVHLGAPGVEILSTKPNNMLVYYDSTSAAAAHVSGAAVLVLAISADLTLAQLKSRLLASVDVLPSLAGTCVTGGRLNVCKAIPGCVRPDFSLAAEPSSVSLPPRGGTASYSIAIARTGGFNAPVSLSMSGLPAGASASFSPNPANDAATLVVEVPPKVHRGTYPIVLTGSAGGFVRSASVTVITKAHK